MNNMEERYLFIVAVDFNRFTNISALGIFKTQIRRKPQSIVEKVPELMKINFYHDLFVGIVDLPYDSAESQMVWGSDSVRSLMGQIFEPLNIEGDEDFTYLTWVLVPLSELTTLNPAEAVLSIVGASGGTGGRTGSIT